MAMSGENAVRFRGPTLVNDTGGRMEYERREVPERHRERSFGQNGVATTALILLFLCNSGPKRSTLFLDFL
ncbi:hypothetical protein SAMN02927900_00920 [Rhizobium mongolense subsp. loessense]|uniref:Uncharacterized protein n=1 Tax=Rhizobium mongolense subsp. loessense TaxID=158890 RepID=A0A1G4PSD4_9HYPH|nr:hypothetical protein SAMN02927900_00920 [Rhizobium mongolense subsp. loessense]